MADRLSSIFPLAVNAQVVHLVPDAIRVRGAVERTAEGGALRGAERAEPRRGGCPGRNCGGQEAQQDDELPNHYA